MATLNFLLCLSFVVSFFKLTLAYQYGYFWIQDIQACKSTSPSENNTVSLLFTDPNTPGNNSYCTSSWAPNKSAPMAAVIGTCKNMLYEIEFETYEGPDNFTLQLFHSFQDDSIGEAPYNWLDMVAFLNVAESPDYTCNAEKTQCSLASGVQYRANVSQLAG